MPYTAGAQGAQANCAAVFVTTLDTALVAAGFVFVEQVVNGPGTARVYKSPAASNFFGQDWFLCVNRNPDTGTTVGFRVLEQYNSTTHLCFNYAPSGASLTPTASFAVNDAAGKSPDSSSLLSLIITINTTGFAYYFSLTPNRVVIATRTGSTDYGVYAGLYDDLLPIAMSPFPLVVSYITNVNGTEQGAATREPNTTTSILDNFKLSTAGTGPMRNHTAIPNPETLSGQILMSRVLLGGRGGLSTCRGLARDLWEASLSGTNGDTITATINGAAKTLTQVRHTSSLGMFVDQAL